MPFSHATIMPMFEKWRKTKLQKRNIKKIVKERSVRQKQIFVGVTISIVLGLIITGIWYGTRISSLQITQVEVMGGYTIPHSEIEDRVHERLVGTYFKLVPHTFRPIYPKAAILDYILTIPRIKNVHVEVLDTQKIIVVFEEYKPAALWCENHETKECLFLDEVGYAFSQAPELTGSAFIRYVDVGHPPEVKQQGFESEFIDNSQEFAELLAGGLDLYVTHVEKVDALDVLYTVSGGGVLKVSQLMTLAQSFKNLESILGSEDFIHLQNGAFQYIDLRFGDKIFLSEDAVEQEVATSTEQ